MKNTKKIISTLVCLLLLSACNKTTILKKILGKESKEVVELMATESAEKILRQSHVSDLLKANVKSLDDEMAKKFARDVAENKSLVDLFNGNPKILNIWKKVALSSVSTSTKYLNYLNSLPSDKFIFEVSKDGVLSVFDKSRRELAKIFPDKLIAKSGLRLSDNLVSSGKYIWNDLLNGKLLPNQLYKVDSWFFKTDKLSRVSSINGSILRIKPSVVHDKSKGITSIPNGPWERINQFKMSPDLIQGEWKMITAEWATIIKNKGKVNFKITPFYDKSSKEAYQHVIEYTNRRGDKVLKTLKNVVNDEVSILAKNLDSWASKANYNLKVNKRSVSVFDKNGEKLGSIVKKGDHQTVSSFPLLGRKMPNPLLDNPLLPNTTYKVNNIINKTDDLGRPIESLTDRITKNDINRTLVRGKSEQKIALENGGLGGHIDHGGHLMAHKLGGSKGALNIVPQNGKLNIGDYKRVEDFVYKHSPVIKNYKINAFYKGNSRRPEKFTQSFEFLGSLDNLQGITEEFLKKGKKLTIVKKELSTGKEYFECFVEHVNLTDV